MKNIELAIKAAAVNAQARLSLENGEFYSLSDLQNVYACWFEDSIDALLDECIPTATGTNRHAFNSYAFQNRFNAIAPLETAEALVAEERENIEYTRRSLQAA